MGRKLTIEFIRTEFAKEGYELLTKVYENSKQKLEYICPMEHRHSIKWNGWQHGCRCPYCAGNGKLTVEFIRAEFEKEGYKLLTTVYENANQRLDYICPKGHRHFIMWSSWQQGQRCFYCRGNIKPTIEFIRSEFKKECYELLTKVYENNQQKLDYICPKGHKHFITWSSWQQNQRCSYCAHNVKLTIKFVRKSFEKEGYTLLTKTYKNNSQKLKYICPKGHKHFITWHNWQIGQRCPYCVGKGKPTIESIRTEFEKEGYTLLSTEYKNSRSKLDYICPKGHKHNVNWDHWKQGTRCLYCSGRAKLTIEVIRAEFAKEGYELLTNIYEGSGQKLDYICPRGHRHNISWDSWNSKNKHRCLYCAGQGGPAIEFIRSEFAKEGYKLLTTTYENNKQKLEYVCPRGHRRYMGWNSWQRGQRCSCYANNVKLTIEFIRAEFAKEGYTLLTKIYENVHQKLEYICPMGHRHRITWAKWNSKERRRCPFCNNNTGVSKWERTIKKFLGELNIDYIPNDRTQLLNPKTNRPLELDIWLPNLNKAIECNGLYWHSKNERKECDKIKRQLCKDQGINLLVITDREWKVDINKCKNRIQKFLC